MQVVADAQEQVVQDGGIIHEDAMWVANEMALDGASPTVIVKTLKQPQSERYRPRGGWRQS